MCGTWWRSGRRGSRRSRVGFTRVESRRQMVAYLRGLLSEAELQERMDAG